MYVGCPVRLRDRLLQRLLDDIGIIVYIEGSGS